MIDDFRTAATGETLEFDLCFIGGGAAAVAAARRLAGSGVKVGIFESGGRGPDADAMSLTAGETSGVPYFALNDSRVRMLGGSTYRWGARSAPMRAIDFAAREWAPMSGWPFTGEELAPFSGAVHEIVGLRQPFSYDAGVFDLFKAAPPAFDTALFDFAAFQFGKTLIFGEAFAPELAAADNISVFLHANITDIAVTNEGTHVTEAKAQTLDGKSVTVRARIFVLACGGIDNPRMLLNWMERSPHGKFDGANLVGRYFMEHPTLTAGTVRSDDWQKLCNVFTPGLVEGRYVETALAPSPAMQREKKILNAAARVRPVVSEDATQALREIVWNARHRKIPLNLQWYKNEWMRERVGAIAKDPFSIPANLIRHALGKPKRFKTDSIILELRTEQAPNAQSRVTLARACDPLGFRRAHLHWDMTPLDKHTMRVMADTVDMELRRLGLGRLEQHDWLKTDDLVWADDLIGGHHHMGTTRMSDMASTGVVDRNSKMHGIDNLYVAGSSVFPTASFVNPTFTLLSLSLRLADHLKTRLAG